MYEKSIFPLLALFVLGVVVVFIIIRRNKTSLLFQIHFSSIGEVYYFLHKLLKKDAKNENKPDKVLNMYFEKGLISEEDDNKKKWFERKRAITFWKEIYYEFPDELKKHLLNDSIELSDIRFFQELKYNKQPRNSKNSIIEKCIEKAIILSKSKHKKNMALLIGNMLFVTEYITLKGDSERERTKQWEDLLNSHLELDERINLTPSWHIKRFTNDPEKHKKPSREIRKLIELRHFFFSIGYDLAVEYLESEIKLSE